MDKFDFENLDPAGSIDLKDLNDIAFVGGYEDIGQNSVSAVTAVVSAVTAVTHLFTCSAGCCPC